MMFKGSLRWLSFEEGGRKQPVPPGSMYYCTTEFPPNYCFSIAVNTHEQSRLRFIVHPSQLAEFKFEIGQEIKLMEGSKVVGFFKIDGIE